MTHKVHGTFVSEKINKVRWRPDPFNNVHSFVTGSWDNKEANTIKLWDSHETNEGSDIYPFVVDTFPHKGDVTEIEFTDSEHFVCSSSSGTVNFFKIIYDFQNEMKIHSLISWNNAHRFRNGDECPCLDLAVHDDDLVTVGENGVINLLSLKNDKIVKVIDSTDSCSIKCVLFLKHNEILTSNLWGQMKIWDLRCSTEPSCSFPSNNFAASPTCLESHPTQKHLIISGDDEGSLTVWDLRQNTLPINVLNAHEETITEIHVHPEYPDHLFTSSNTGEIWHWSTKSRSTHSFEDESDLKVWFASTNIRNRLEVFTLMDRLHKPVNSFHINQNKILCSCDNEAIYLINGIKMNHS